MFPIFQIKLPTDICHIKRKKKAYLMSSPIMEFLKADTSLKPFSKNKISI
jgi:hypothetical protein